MLKSHHRLVQAHLGQTIHPQINNVNNLDHFTPKIIDHLFSDANDC